MATLYNMDRRTGSTALVPGSHVPDKVEAIKRFRDAAAAREQAGQSKLDEEDERAASLAPFRAAGLEPAITSVAAGDLLLFDTGTYHGCCNAEDPHGDELLRAMFILSYVPRQILTPEILWARRRAYELGLNCTLKPDSGSGSVMGPEVARQLREEEEAEGPRGPTRHSWDRASAAVRRMVVGADGAAPPSEVWGEIGGSAPQARWGWGDVGDGRGRL